MGLGCGCLGMRGDGLNSLSKGKEKALMLMSAFFILLEKEYLLLVKTKFVLICNIKFMLLYQYKLTGYDVN